MDKKRIKADILLVIAAIVWGSAFSAQRVAAEANIGTFLFNGTRFLLGGLILLPFAMKRKPSGSQKSIYWILPAGMILFIAGFFQQAGLNHTTAGNAGFITGLYVIFVPILLFFLFKQKQPLLTWAGALVAVAGLFLLSVQDQFVLNKGDGLEVIGAVFWASHVVLVSRIIKGIDVLQFASGQAIVAGLFNLVTGLSFELETIGGFETAWWTVLYTGIFSVAIAYTLQVAGQRHAPATDAALILSTEAIFAAFFGYMFLNELLSFKQFMGCVLIIVGIIVVQLKPKTIKNWFSK